MNTFVLNKLFLLAEKQVEKVSFVHESTFKKMFRIFICLSIQLAGIIYSKQMRPTAAFNVVNTTLQWDEQKFKVPFLEIISNFFVYVIAFILIYIFKNT